MTSFFVLINLWTFQINLVIEKFFVTATAAKKIGKLQLHTREDLHDKED